jgi:hypothetical protein
MLTVFVQDVYLWKKHRKFSLFGSSLRSNSFNDSIRHQCAFEACHEDSVNYENLKLNDQINNNMEIKVCIFTVISRAHESKQFCFSF